MRDNFALQVITTLVPMILSLTVHEFAHAIVALRLGDRTAEEQGRVTLNPISHIDPIGTLLIPVMLLASGGGFFFGWAKPVPYNPLRFNKGVPMGRGAMWVALAGPAANFTFAVVVTVLYGLSQRFHVRLEPALVALADRLILVNIGLGFFNLLPVPPLDGSKVLWGLLPAKEGDAYMDLMVKAGSVAFIGVVMLGGYLLAAPISGTWHFIVGFLLPAIRGV
jgi:Zn-dependent protease